MPATDPFLNLLRRSKLIEPELIGRLDAGDSQAVLETLVEQQRLTPWQAQQLLAGRADYFFGKYKLLAKIGEGGMGAVYKAEQTNIKRLVALKLISDRVVAQSEVLTRFHREMQAVAALNHPNVVKALDADQVGRRPFLVMEYVEGDNLKEYIQRYGRLPIDWSCEIIRQLALGLQHAWIRQIIHRDIKPSNLLVVGDAPDNNPQVKILDMGLARFAAEAQHTQLTTTGQVLGTIDYISPEQAQDTRGVDTRADIFSLGCSLFQLLTGTVPFAGKNPMEKLMARAVLDAPRAKSLRLDLPDPLDAIVAKMVARSPDHRFATPGEVAEALLPFTSHGASLAGVQAAAQIPSSQTPIPELQADETLDLFMDSLAAEVLTPEPAEHESPPRPVVGKGRWVWPLIAVLFVFTVAAYGWYARSAEVTLDWPATIRDRGQLMVDGQPILIPDNGRISLRLGSRKIGVSYDGYPSIERNLIVAADSDNRLPIPAPMRSPFAASEAKDQQRRWSQFIGTSVEVTNSIGIALVLIPAGEFQMGDGSTHPVRLTRPFRLGRFETTQEQYQQVMGSTPAHFKGASPMPVEQVSWHSAIAFCNRLSQREGRAAFYKIDPQDRNHVTILGGNGYRLPTEAEWEYACRAGEAGDWCFGDDEPNLLDYAWFRDNSSDTTHHVGKKQPNAFGLYDLHGNVWEWCFDRHGSIPNLLAVDPIGASVGSARVIRGGSWATSAAHCRSAARNYSRGPANEDSDIGFRVAVGIP